MKRRILIQTIRDKINDLGLTSHARRVVDKGNHESGGIVSYFARLKNQKRGTQKEEEEERKKEEQNRVR
jgi:hypothetical protein